MEKKRNLWVIPTDKPSRILFDKEENRLLPLQDSTVFMQYQDLVENQHIYITNEEEIKDGDYWIYICPINGLDYGDNNNPIVKNNLPNSWFNKLHDKLNYKKIILTTDQDLIKDGVQSIDDEFLEWFVKNPSCEEIKIANSLVRVSSFDWRTDYKIIIPSSEIWKDVPEFEGYYQVSNLGNVKSLSRTILGRGKHNTLLKERILKFSTSTNGYYQVILQKEGFKKIYKVHSLVAICFLNHTPDGTHNVVIDHINEVKTDNRLENLRLIGHRENVSRSMKNNTSTYVGVSWSKNAKKWISQITIEGKTKYLGLFDNEEDANKKYLETLKDL